VKQQPPAYNVIPNPILKEKFWPQFNSGLLPLLVLVIGLYFPAQLLAQDDTVVADFNAAYRNYQSTSEAGQWNEAVDAARDALRLGRTVQGEENQTVAALTYNYALALLNAHQNEQATRAFEEVVAVFNTVFGEQAETHISVYFDAGRNQIELADGDAAASQFRQSIELAGQYMGENSPDLGGLNLDAGIMLLDQANSVEARDFLVTAHEIFATALGDDNPTTAFSAYYLGKFWLADGSFRRAESSLTEALPVLQAAGDDMLPVVSIVHAHLVEVYSQRGRSADATSHLVQYAVLAQNQLARPIFMPAAEMSRRTAGTESVDFVVDVTAEGFAENIRADEQADQAAAEAALDALENWRFVPLVENDKTMAAADIEITVPFARPQGR